MILFISREISRTTPTKINNDVVPRPLKLETFKMPSITFGRVGTIVKKNVPPRMIPYTSKGKDAKVETLGGIMLRWKISHETAVQVYELNSSNRKSPRILKIGDVVTHLGEPKRRLGTYKKREVKKEVNKEVNKEVKKKQKPGILQEFFSGFTW